MKKLVTLILFLSIISLQIKAQQVTEKEALQVAGNFLQLQPNELHRQMAADFNSESPSAQPFYLYTFDPQGFIVISAKKFLPPVIAYSFNSNPDPEGRFVAFLKQDLSNRLANQPSTSAQEKSYVKQLWNLYSGVSRKSPLFQQWPPAGTTPTGGWLETNWTQDAPYNDLCPMDPITQTRSIAGCPSVAMAMIVNYHHTTHNVWFTDADDYHHAYQGRNYWIDDDYDSLDFPSFPGLNNYLSSLEAKYQQGTGLTGQDKAALVFACGVAATQVYTSSGSGTFGVSQAYAAYQKFNFTQSLLLGPNDTSLYTHMAQNIKDSLPVHLAIVNSTWTSGHNIVVDGYNTNQYFHLNFGWGGSSNAWYLLPSQIPYSLNVIEGAIVDIDPSLPVGICKAEKTDIQVYPNPVEDNINLFGTLSGLQFTIFSLEGKTISNTFCSSGQSFVIPVSNLSSGIYFLTITGPAGKTVKKVIKK